MFMYIDLNACIVLSIIIIIAIFYVWHRDYNFVFLRLAVGCWLRLKSTIVIISYHGNSYFMHILFLYIIRHSILIV